MNEFIALGMFVAVCLVLMAGYPVAFTLAGTALAFAAGGVWAGIFDSAFLEALPNRLYGIMTNETLVAVPLFVFMGVMLERSKVAETLLETMAALFGGLRGGLGISVTLVGMLLAASTGIIGATVVTMGLLSLPTMIKRGYDPALSAGTICASGTLGQIIPPSIVLVLLGDVLSSAYQQAQLDMGIFSPDTVSVGDLFAGALLPGLLLVGLYLGYLLLVAWLRPAAMPALPHKEEPQRDLWQRALLVLLPPMALIVAVLGSIMAGIATPTEAASVGAIGALLLAGVNLSQRNRVPVLVGVVGLLILLLLPVKQVFVVSLCLLALLWAVFVSLRSTLRRDAGMSESILVEVMRSTTRVTSMVFLIFIGASVFSLVFRGFGGDEAVREILTSLPGGVVGAMLVVMLVMFLLGFVLDFIEITFVVVPIVGPVLLALGLDPVWLGVMIAINLQTSFLTPPFGFALFYLRGVAPAEVTTSHLYRGVVPFIIIQLIALGLLAMWPSIATWLPDQVYGLP